ncbi:MAG: DNA-methyltransferase [Microcella sp.]
MSVAEELPRGLGPLEDPFVGGDDVSTEFSAWRKSANPDRPLLILGDSSTVLRALPEEAVNMVITSPPYWNQRQYESNGLGLESTPSQFIDGLLGITAELHRVIASDGSFWLNLGDSYFRKSLAGVPWRTAIRMIDEQGWILRNDVVWSKLKGGMDTARDRLANTHEMLFHFVKQPSYYYDTASIRSKPRSSKLVNGAVVSATGVTGVRYKRKIELSTELSLQEKADAMIALDDMLSKISTGEYSDFRMVIRGGGQRVTHSDQDRVSGRAKELRDRGFYFLKYHPDGAKPSDVWDIVPEDTQNRGPNHYAAYPEELCRIPILATCPPEGVVLDPFVGTGTTLLAARSLGRRAVGIDVSSEYLRGAASRLLP